MNLIPFLVLWIVLAIIVLVLAISRMRLAHREDASLDVLEGDRVVEQQKEIATKLKRIDWWGQVLTVVVVLYGIILAGIHIYQTWQQSSKIQP
jgi:beta-lactamase regulating signal transducer with metallopeptidase domain